jgi:hypothetical protein
LRIVLHEVYGIRSSTFHRESAYPFDPDYASHAAVKTHLLPHQLVPDDPAIPAVYLVRDGRDAVVSMAHHQADLVHPGTDYREALRETILAEDGSHFGGWSQHVSRWLERANIVIRFEDLIANPIEQVERLRPILELPAPRVDRTPCFDDLRKRSYAYGSGREHGLSDEQQRHRRERFFRRGQPGAWREEMPEHEQRRFRKLYRSALLRLGYKPDRLGGQIRYYTRRVIDLATARGSQIGP